MTYAEQVIQSTVGKTVANAVPLEDGVRFTFTDGTMVQVVYDVDEGGLLIQEAIGD